MDTRTIRKRCLPLLMACLFLAFTAQGQKIHITVVHHGAWGSVKLFEQVLLYEEVLDSTAYPDSIFNELVMTSGAIGGGRTTVDYFDYSFNEELEDDEFTVFKIVFDSKDEKQTIIGCFGHKRDVKFTVRPFKGKTGMINSMEMYRQGVELERKGKKRQANKLYEHAASCGNSLAAGRLAYNYWKGIGCTKSNKKATHWATIAEFAFGGSPFTKAN